MPHKGRHRHKRGGPDQNLAGHAAKKRGLGLEQLFYLADMRAGNWYIELRIGEDVVPGILQRGHRHRVRNGETHVGATCLVLVELPAVRLGPFAGRAHDPEADGSNPSPATKKPPTT